MTHLARQLATTTTCLMPPGSRSSAGAAQQPPRRRERRDGGARSRHRSRSEEIARRTAAAESRRNLACSVRVSGYPSRASAARGRDTARMRYVTSPVAGSRRTSKISSPASAWSVSVPYANPNVEWRGSLVEYTTRQPFNDQNPKWRMATATTVPSAMLACRGWSSTQPRSKCRHSLSAAVAHAKAASPVPMATTSSSTRKPHAPVRAKPTGAYDSGSSREASRKRSTSCGEGRCRRNNLSPAAP